MIRDFIEFCNNVNLQKVQGGLFFVLYKSIDERDLKLKEICENLNLIFNLKVETVDFFNINFEDKISNIMSKLEFHAYNFINTESLINGNNVFHQILESKRELIIRNKIIVFWLTMDEYQSLSEKAPNFVSFGRGAVFEIADKSLLNISDIKRMIKQFEKQYGLSSKKFLIKLEKGDLPESYEFNLWKFLLKGKEEWKM